MSDAMKANKVSTTENRRRKKTAVEEKLVPDEAAVELSNDQDESETVAKDIILAVEKRKKEPLGKEKRKIKKAPVRKEVDSKKGGKKEPVKKRVKETITKKK
ncbi:hypothetical protein KY284_001427 [Solanum tuberosum]|nr:hypothetical protein KY284_001427 [Solanum tuberosum]